MKPKHPGKVLRTLIEARGLSTDAFAIELQIERRRIIELMAGQRRIIQQMDGLLADYLGTTPGFWLELQRQFDQNEPYVTPPVTHHRQECDHQFNDPELRNRALLLVDAGLSSEQAGEQLAVKKMTVAGWRAARTKGQYDDEK